VAEVAGLVWSIRLLMLAVECTSCRRRSPRRMAAANIHGSPSAGTGNGLSHVLLGLLIPLMLQLKRRGYTDPMIKFFAHRAQASSTWIHISVVS
jgi:hypothetical protein